MKKNVAYNYRLDVEKIKEFGILEAEDILILSEISKKSYSFPEYLLTQAVQLRKDFVVNHLNPVLRNEVIKTSITENQLEYIKCDNILFEAWECNLFSLQKELMDQSISVDEITVVGMGIIQGLCLEILYKASEIDTMLEIIIRNSLTSVAHSRIDPIVKLLVEHELFISKFFAKEIQKTIKLNEIMSQTPFLLEVKRIVNVLDH